MNEPGPAVARGVGRPLPSPAAGAYRSSMTPPPIRQGLNRGEARPIKRRTRTFRPNYLMLCPTYQCNLACPHCCVPIEWTDRLDIPAARRFLEDAHAYGVRTLGFTG